MCGHDVLIYERLSYIYIHITPLTAYSKEEGYSLRSRHQMQEDHQSLEVNVPYPLLLYIYIYAFMGNQWAYANSYAGENLKNSHTHKSVLLLNWCAIRSRVHTLASIKDITTSPVVCCCKKSKTGHARHNGQSPLKTHLICEYLHETT